MDDRSPRASDLAGWAARLEESLVPAFAAPERIGRFCAQTLDVSGVGVSVVTDAGNRSVVYSTDAGSAAIEELQATLGEGPCVDAVRQAAPVLVPDLREQARRCVDRWPTFVSEADRAGVRAVFAFPLRVGRISLGAIDLYRSTPGALTRGDLAASRLAADATVVALLELASETSPGSSAVPHQLEVHQATGMVLAQMGITASQALLVLRARAFADGRPLAQVAADVVSRRLRFGSEDG